MNTPPDLDALTLPSEKSAKLELDLTELLTSLNRGGDHALVVPSEYLEVVIRRS